jgi:prevent-host-death family protein
MTENGVRTIWTHDRDYRRFSGIEVHDPSPEAVDRRQMRVPKSDLSDSFPGVTRLSATEVGRRFSEVLNRVAAGEEIEVTRAGAPVAVIVPPKTRLLSAERFRELLAAAPPIDEEFVADVTAIRKSVGAPESRWPS